MRATTQFPHARTTALVLLTLAWFGAIPAPASAAPVPLFDGKSFTGWQGDTAKTWRIENGEIVAGKPDVKQPRNQEQTRTGIVSPVSVTKTK